MAGAALLEQQTEHFPPALEEVYAGSLRNIRILGGLATRNALASQEAIGVTNEVWNDFTGATAENLSTDKEYGNQLRFNPMKSYDKVNGQTVDKNGVPIISIVREGYEASKQAAEADPEMVIQAERDEGDVIIMEIVDDLLPGEMLATTSMEPKRALKRNPKLWRDKLNYSEGMAVVQVYYCTLEGKILAGAYSVKQSDMSAFRRMFSLRRVDIPEGESEDRWSRYGIRKFVSQAEAEQYGHVLEAEHRREIGNTDPVYSVTELMDENRNLVKKYFDAYIVPLSKASFSKENNFEMQSYAHALLNNPDVVNKLSSDGRQNLMRVTSSSKFTESDARFMEERVRYALIEELRQLIPDFIASRSQVRVQQPVAAAPAEFMYVPDTISPDVIANLNMRAAANVGRGEQAGRSYGGVGCTGAGSRQSDIDTIDALGSQDVFGGKVKNETSDNSSDSVECEYSGTFCYCCPYDNDGSPLLAPVEVTAKRDKEGTARCQRTGCGATLDKNGKGSKGKIYEKAMQRARQTKKVAA